MQQQTEDAQTDKFQTGNVLTVSFAHMLHDIYSSFLSPVLPLLIDKLGISYALSSFLSVLQRLPSVINPFVGLLADRLSLRYLIIAAPALTAVAMSLLGVAPGYTVLVILLLVMGVASALFHVPAPVMIRKLSGSRRGMGMSFYMLGGEIARTLGPLIILGGVSLWGFEGTWRLMPFALAASFILFLRLRRVKVYKHFEKTQKAMGGWQSFKGYIPYLLPIALFLLFNAFVRQALRFYLPTYMDLQGESLWMGGISLSVFQLSGAAGSFLGGTISDRFGRLKTLSIASVLTPVLMWLFVHTSGAVTKFLLLIGLGVASVGSGPVILAFVNEIPTDRMAFLNGIYMSLAFLIGSGDIMMVGGLSDWIGLETTFNIAAFVSLGAIPTIPLLRRNLVKIRRNKE